MKLGCQACLGSIHKFFFLGLVELTQITNYCFSNQNEIIIEAESRAALTGAGETGEQGVWGVGVPKPEAWQEAPL